MGGRGAGKTRIGVETCLDWALTHPGDRIAVVAATNSDLRKTIFMGESGFISCLPAGASDWLNLTHFELRFPNGSLVQGFSAEEPGRLRGPQFHFAWCDELAAWSLGSTDRDSSKALETWDMLMMGLRLGEDPRVIATTTPKPVDLVRQLLKDPTCHVTRESSYANRANLSPVWFEELIKKYEGTRLGRQELEAEFLDDMPGALWKMSMIDPYRVELSEIRWDLLDRIVVAIDPAVTAHEESDETGIVVAALTRSMHVIVLADLSCRESPLEWARIAVGAYRKWRADRIVGEVNNGGDLVGANIYAVAPDVAFRAVRASRGKAIRAEPVAALYEQGRVHHLGSFAKLEEQLCAFVPGIDTRESPDRMDALVWAISELLVDREEMDHRLVISDPQVYQISPV